LLQSLQYCASLKWYERKQDLTGHGFTYNVDFDVAVRDRSRQRRIAIEQTSGLLGESGFDLHKKERHAKDIPVYWEKEVLFGGKAIADGNILLDSGANTQFLTKDTDTGLHPLIDEEANLEFLESHYHNNRHKDSNMIDSDEYEEYLRFKAGQRQQNSRHHYVFNW
jgi:hypothetical protein